MTSGAQPNPRLTGRPLLFVRILWIGLAVGYLALWLASLPGFYERVSTLTIEPYRLGETTILDNERVREDALERGLSLQAVEVVEETMQPESVTLRLKKTADGPSGRGSVVGGHLSAVTTQEVKHDR